MARIDEVGKRPKLPSVATETGRELYHLDQVVQAVDIALPAVYAIPLDNKKAR